MANIMKEVANALGIELEEEFNIAGDSNKYQLSIYGLEVWSDTCKDWCPAVGLEDILIGNYKIIKLPKSILNDTEKEYLGNIIKPFRDRVISIKKIENSGEECLIIQVEHFKDKSIREIFMLPSFEKKTMYQGMELGKRYTLEELGL